MNIFSVTLRKKLRRVRVLALDHDGVLATTKIMTGIIMPRRTAKEYVADKKDFEAVIEAATYDHRDGRGIEKIQEQNIKVVIITTQRSGFVVARAWKMGVDIIQTKNKLEELTRWLAKHCYRCGLDEVCFVGDDDGDIEVMKAVGVAVCVADGIKDAQRAAHYITQKNGGDGAVREVCDLIIKSQA